MCCEIESHNLALRPEYYALSYTWGSEDSPVMISLNGTPHWIQTNLHSFLLQLRLRKGRRTLWVDSICINQQDNTDKSWSIPLMKDIYASAQSVLVWLGPHLDGSAKLFDYIYLQLSGGVSRQAEDVRASMPDDSTGPLDPTSNTDLLQPLTRLIHRPYWTRTWIIQEIVLAKNIRVFCGNSSVPWADFTPIVQRLCQVLSLQSPSSPFQSICELQKIGANLIFDEACLMEYCAPDSKKNLTTHHSACKDKRDLIYGVLGLVKDRNHNLTIDYSCTMEALICSILTCYKGKEPLLYYGKLSARFGISPAQCLKYVKDLVRRRVAEDESDLLAPRWHVEYGHVAIDSTVFDDTQSDALTINGWMRFTSVWEAKDGLYRRYHSEDVTHTDPRTHSNTMCIWTNVVVRRGDSCEWRDALYWDGRWRLVLFKRPHGNPETGYSLLGFGIEMLRQAAAADFKQAGRGMATFFEDGYSYFMGEPKGLGSWTRCGTSEFESYYKGLQEPTLSILDLLKIASFADVFDAVHGEAVLGDHALQMF